MVYQMLAIAGRGETSRYFIIVLTVDVRYVLQMLIHKCGNRVFDRVKHFRIQFLQSTGLECVNVHKFNVIWCLYRLSDTLIFLCLKHRTDQIRYRHSREFRKCFVTETKKLSNDLLLYISIIQNVSCINVCVQ